MPAQFLPGYFLYFAVVFLPGIGFGEFFNLWKRYESISQRLALGFALGLVIDTIAFALRDYGPRLFGLPAMGIDRPTLYALMLLGLSLFLVAAAHRRKVLFAKRPHGKDVLVWLLLAVLAIMIELYLTKFPIFPEFQSGDFSAHVTYAETVASGSSPPGVGVLYDGVRFQLASALLLIGGEGLITSRDAIAVLVVLSPLVFYLASADIFENATAGIIVTSLYALTATIWFVSVFNTGLYSNFFGIIITLFLIVLVKWVIDEPKSKAVWLAFLMGVFAAYFSHYTTITVIPALVVISLLQLWKERSRFRNYIAPVGVLVLPLLVVLVLRPTFFHYLLGLAISGGGSVSNTTYLSKLLASVPVLQYIAAEVSDDVAVLVLSFLAAVCSYATLKSRKFGIFPFLWLISLLIAAPFDVSAWRFSFEAIVPLTLMAGYGLYLVLSSLNRRISLQSHRFLRVTSIVIILFLLPLLYGSWGNRVVTDSISNVSSTSQVQRDVYTSIYWLKSNTPANSTYLSITDWRMTYTGLMIDRPTYYKYFSDQNQSLQYAHQVGAEYIIVTQQVTLNLPPLQEYQPWYSFVNESAFTQVYSNPDVRIYQLG